MNELLVCFASLAGALVAAILSELAARFLFSRGRYFVWLPYLRMENQLRRDIFPELETRARLLINSEGERGNEPPSDKRGMHRILIAGGSTAECYYLDQDSCLSTQLERLLQTQEALRKLRAQRIHAGSIARSGIDSAKMWAALWRIVPQHGKVDTAVFLVGASDVLMWLRDDTPSNRAFAPFEGNEFFDRHPQHRYSWTPLRATAIAECARRLNRWLFRQTTIHKNVGGTVEKMRRMRKNAATVRTEVPEHSANLTNFASFLRYSIELCQRAGARVIVVGQPYAITPTCCERLRQKIWNGGVGDVQREIVNTYYSTEVIARLMREFGETAAWIARENDALYVDVQELLQPAEECFYDEFHLTPKGSAIVAKAIASALLKMADAGADRDDRCADPELMLEARG
jgi:hypothetical protein